MTTICCRKLAALLVCLALAGMGLAESFTWTGTQNGDWFVAGNWTPAGGPPAAGDNVVYNTAGASLLLTNATPLLNSFTMQGGTLTCANWFTRLRATTVTLNAGTLTLPASFTTSVMSNRIHIVCDNLTVAATAMLNADEKGYSSANGPGTTGSSAGGYGGSGGAGHGGIGGTTSGGRVGGIVYGDAVMPAQPGSGAGPTTSVAGGKGGGVIRLEVAQHAVLNGTLSANGQAGINGPAYRFGGGGAGGAILLICQTLSGSGTLRANGGQGYNDPTWPGGGGGGGRIALHFDAAAQALLTRPLLTLSAAPGKTAFPLYDRQYWLQSDWGSIYCTDFRQLVDLHTDIQRVAGYLRSPAITQIELDALVVAPGAAFGFDTSMTVVVTNTVTVSTNSAFMARSTMTLDCGSTFTNRGRVWLSGVNAVSIDGDLILPEANSTFSIKAPTLSVGGDLQIKGADLYVSAGAVAIAGVHTGGTFTVIGDWVLDQDAWVHVYADFVSGGAVRMSCSSLVVPTDCGFDAEGKGYAPATGPGTTLGSGDFSGGSGGAGHGGVGGTSSGAFVGGIAYGDAVHPRHPGSGAGSTTSEVGGPGGAAIWLQVANNIQLDGILNANGKQGGGATFYRWGGGGAGGSILLECETLTGSGTLSADGASGIVNASFMGGGGGGGRIAVHFDTAAQALLPRPDLLLSVKPGLSAFPPYARHYWIRADWGSLYLTDMDAFVDLTPPVGGINGYLLEEGLTQRTFAALSVQPGYAFGFDTNMTITVTGGISIPANAAFLARRPLQMTCGGSVTNLGRLAFAGATTLSVGGEIEVAGADADLAIFPASLTVAEGVHVHDGADWRVFGAPTNGLPGQVGGDVTVAGDIRIETAGRLHPYTDLVNGGAVRIACRNLSVDAGCAIDADYKGFGSQSGPGKTAYTGTIAGGSGGAGHGGAGGAAASGSPGGISYGSRSMPATPGSGAGNTQQNVGGAGGGVIWIDAAEQILLNGWMSADAEHGRIGAAQRFSGGGAGGSILLVCKRLNGGGEFGAIGGNGYADPTKPSGGGGGGRIAVWYGLSRTERQPLLDNLNDPEVQQRIVETGTVNGFAGTISGVAGGTGFVQGGVGTLVFFKVMAPPGSVIILR